MSLAIWEYFWNPADWTPAPPVTPPAVTAPTKFGAKGKGYHPLPDIYWETRKRYLDRFVAPVLATIPLSEINKISEVEPVVKLTQQKLGIAINRAYTALDSVELQKASTRIQKLVLDIQELRVQYNNQAAIFLLLDLF